MKITTYKGYTILYDKQNNKWVAEDYQGSSLLQEGLDSMHAVEKALDRIDRKIKPENYGEKPKKIPAFIMEYGDYRKLQSVVVTSEDENYSEVWVSDGKKHWKVEKDEVFYDTPENKVIVKELGELQEARDGIDKKLDKIEKTLKNWKGR